MQLNEWLVDSEDDSVWINVNKLSGWSWLSDLSLGRDFLSSLVSLVLEFIVLLNSLDEGRFAVRDDYVLSSNVNSLLDESSVDGLVDLDTDGSWVHVEDLTGSSVVEVVWETLLDGRVGHDSHVVTDLQVSQVSADVDRPVGSERSLEFLSSFRSLS